MKFKDFLKNEGYSIFGFTRKYGDESDLMLRSPNFDTPDQTYPNPIVRFDLEKLTNELAESHIGGRIPSQPNFDIVQWGVGNGAVRARFSTKFEVVIERLTYDLQGDPVWIGKKWFSINSDYFGSKENVVASDILKEATLVYQSPPDSAARKPGDMDRLVQSIAQRTSTICNDPLFFEDIKKISDNRYIVVFGVRGHGLQAPGQNRMEQVMLEMNFIPETGIMKLFLTNVESPISQHEWILAPTNFSFNFVPTQPRDEIVQILSSMMKYY